MTGQADGRCCGALAVEALFVREMLYKPGDHLARTLGALAISPNDDLVDEKKKNVEKNATDEGLV